MLNWLFNIFNVQAEYGVAVPMYGIQDPGPANILLAILKFVLLPIVIPAVLTIGALVYTKKKAYPPYKRILVIAIMLIIYFGLFIGAGLLFNWF